jgi:putative flippase GtrA
LKAVASRWEQSRGIRNELLRFVGAGGLFFVSGLGLTALCREFLHMPEQLAAAVAFVALFLASFLLNRYFVFRSAESGGKQFARFALISGTVRALEYSLYLLLLQLLSVHYILAMATTLVVSNCVKFGMYRTFVFNRSRDA